VEAIDGSIASSIFDTRTHKVNKHARSSDFDKMPPSRSLFLTGNPSAGKTTMLVHVVNSVLTELAGNSNVNLRGFYTEECRQNGTRAGFDIVHILPNSGIQLADVRVNCDGGTEDILPSISARAPLARMGSRGSGPMVGKYEVDVPSIKANAIPSIDPSVRVNKSSGNVDVTLVLIDEVGKMEMYCDGFLETVHQCLDSDNCIVLGTLPTPRYGHIIQAVEDVRARSDVTVVYVTKQNRDELRDHVKEAVLSALQSDANDSYSGESFASALSTYLYDRDIGAPKMNQPGSGKVASVRNKLAPRGLSRSTKKEEGRDDENKVEILPCGPLTHESIPPKALLLGDTASPLPADDKMCYAERSMWTVFGKMFDKHPSGSNMAREEYITLQSSALSSGIAIWDVLSDVHVEGSKPKNKKMKKESAANPIVDFVAERESIEAIAFIGAKAKKSFVTHFCGGKSSDEFVLDGGRRLQLIVLPSSSRANSRVSVADKAAEWQKALFR
jgi:nucleoside-triphosphatase THEP1/G:T/U-mismatch repair DNA glycosylase